MTKKDVFMFCPPLSQYQEQPLDISKCTIEDCPKCKNKMWLSEKKKEIIKKNEKENIYLLCFNCFSEFAKDNPKMFLNHKRINL